MKLTEQIANYDTLSAEDKLKALEGMDINYDPGEMARLVEENKKLKADGDNAKQTASKHASEIAKLKKAYEERLTEDEKANLAKREADEANELEKQQMRDEIESLKREKTISTLSREYASCGFSSADADAMATAYANGDIAEITRIQRAHYEANEQKLREARLQSQPDPTAGLPPKVKTDEEILEEKLAKAMGL